ncbi:glycogen debranching protein GlgX [Homoserinibacter sp. YIM 151385]|uniref:glycogen debranching protein GlgX n=1 Tax=Homoserinibacter sp. YIM 151385 TaxID=2985506 RepID=UPI0022F05442|nr:glycogen debranching protein GlgX [Homoserinibacter sp. YIM 151385]WBU39137.1 glycogen debranching protein GlgX [Homoserinibacter sp. YIM 151385]
MPGPDPLRDLGPSRTPEGTRVRVWSGAADALELCVLAERDRDRVTARIPMRRDAHGVWEATTPLLQPGGRYAIRAHGPRGGADRFDGRRSLLDPYARGISRSASGAWHSELVDEGFDWGGIDRPRIPMDHTVIYEAHLKGLTKLSPHVPEELRGTYAGLAHESTIGYLRDLGVTTVELLPVHQFTSEERLQRLGMPNYWGYNTLGFFAPHAAYASRAAREGGAGAVLREFKGMVRLLHEAGLEVVLDVVYNHTAEEGPTGPTSSLRGLDDGAYYRRMEDGSYIDTTGCGNTLDTSHPAAARLVLDSLRYWAGEVRVDGFRFDLMASLGRDEHHAFDPEHPLLRAILDDPVLADTKLIAEPWDVGIGGWQVGGFPEGYHEWNDGYRDRIRNFWLRDVASAREAGTASEGIGSLARRIAGSNHVFALERGPLASIDFVTAHDGFTAYDLTAYDRKQNGANGEEDRDGTDDNRSFNHGVEGPTEDRAIRTAREKAVRNLLGTLLLSAGVPMITAGDEYGRSQRGNNNAYCHDSELTWLSWEREPWQAEIHEVVRTLTRLRRENPALRPVRFGRWGERVPSANQMDWYNKQGVAMSLEDWDSPAERTLQYLAASTPEFEEQNRILLVVHGLEEGVEVVLPEHEGVAGYSLLWDSSHDLPHEARAAGTHAPGARIEVDPTSMLLFRAEG